MSHRFIFKVLIASSFITASAFAQEGPTPPPTKEIAGSARHVAHSAAKSEAKGAQKSDHATTAHAAKHKLPDLSHETIEQRHAQMMDPDKKKLLAEHATQAKHGHAKKKDRIED